jgi:hypothetical protein
MTWWRVHFRKTTQIVGDPAELARLQARKVPKIVFVEELKEYECSACHHKGPWQERIKHWCWIGKSDGRSADDAKVLRIFCSDKCRQTAAPDRLPHRRTWWWEPAPFRVERWREIDSAKRAANPRRFPWPEFPKIPDLKKGEAQCRWCGERITSHYAYQRTYHDKKWGDRRHCKGEMLLHIDLASQTRFIIERDGERCWDCGDDWRVRWHDAGPMWPADRGNWIKQEPLEVDHDTPLWLGLLLLDEPELHRSLFGPHNLRLRCPRHHKLKSAAEARDRAKRRM